jgi:hypothetical protein
MNDLCFVSMSFGVDKKSEVSAILSGFKTMAERAFSCETMQTMELSHRLSRHYVSDGAEVE